MSNSNTSCIKIDFSSAKKGSPIKYGWHYEEIGMIGDGGLYAEMIRNRDFGEAMLAPGMEVKDGLYANVPDAGVSHKLPEYLPELHCWEIFGTEKIKTRRRIINEKERRFSMEISSEADLSNEFCGVLNTGFFGMHITEGETYKLLLCLSSDNGGGLKIGIATEHGYISDTVTINDLSPENRKYNFELKGTGNASNAFLLITPLKAGTVSLSFASLFPGNTWDSGKSVFRGDILQNMKDYKPEFLRFPGGCIIHGVNEETMYHWKETIGCITKRKNSWSKWQPHYMSNGLGYHEFYELCEYLGAEAMYVAASGLICTAWAFRQGETDDFCHPDVDVNYYIQDCLDAIEYAIGPVESEWGAKRAENGHPEPFPLTYLSIGNEDFGPKYYKHYDLFYKAIKAKYPQLKIIANSIVGDYARKRIPDWGDKRKRLHEFIDLKTVEILDEHYYESGDWIFENFNRFDAYDRKDPDLMCLELGLHSNQPSDILYESAYLMMMEKNGDLNPVFAGRPLMRNWTYVEGKANPYYYHTNDKSWKTIHYYAKKLFKENGFDIFYPSVYYNEAGSDKFDINTLYSTVGKDSNTGDMIIKVVNLSDTERCALVDIGAFVADIEVSTIINTPELPKTPEQSEYAGAKVEKKKIDFSKEYAFPAKSLTLLRFKG